MTVIAKPVEVLHCRVGNMWDIYKDGIFASRVTYHENKLYELRAGNCSVSVSDVIQVIKELHS